MMNEQLGERVSSNKTKKPQFMKKDVLSGVLFSLKGNWDK